MEIGDRKGAFLEEGYRGEVKELGGGGVTKNVSSSHGVSLWKFSGFFSLMWMMVLE